MKFIISFISILLIGQIAATITFIPIKHQLRQSYFRQTEITEDTELIIYNLKG